MFSKIWLINIFLAVFAIFFGLKAYGVWSEGEKSFSEAPLIEKPSSRPKKRIVKKRAPPESAYSVVVERTLFSPERTEVKPEEAKKSPKAKPKDSKKDKLLMAALKKIVLYGVVIADDYKGALVTDVKTKKVPAKRRLPRQKGARKELIWVKVGDALGDFKVADIMEDRVLLKNGSKSYDVLLYDKNKSKSRESAVTQAKPTVISISSTRPTAVKKPPVKRAPRAGTIKKTGTSKTR